MGKTPSLTNQLTRIVEDHDGIGQSKYEIKASQHMNRQEKKELMRDKIFSYSTRQDFIDANVRFAQWCKSRYGIRLLNEITAKHFREYWTEHKGNWALTTQKTYFDHFDRLNRYLIQRGWGKGFIDDTNRPIIKGWAKIDIRTDRALSWDDDVIEDLKKKFNVYAELFDVLKETGIRAIEMQRLQWDNISFANMEMRVVGKGGRPRTIPLSEVSLQALLRIGEKHGFNGKVFEYVNTQTLRKNLEMYNKQHSLPMRSLHSFRHYYAKENFRKKYFENRRMGMSTRLAIKDSRGFVSHLLGHGKIDQNRGRISVTYAYLSSKECKAIVAEIEELLHREF